jgi:UDP-N-acetylmuramate--alanine ligase
LPIKGITSSWLLEKVNLNIKSLLSSDDLLIRLKKNKPDVLLTMGAGDIDLLVKPIEQLLTQQVEESHV